MDMTAIEQREWILQRENFSLIRQCKKLIQDEFSIHISLVQSNLLQLIIDYSLTSRNPQLKVLSRPIALLHQKNSQIRMYRGQTINIEKKLTATTSSSVEHGSETKKKKIIYRGQRLA